MTTRSTSTTPGGAADAQSGEAPLRWTRWDVVAALSFVPATLAMTYPLWLELTKVLPRYSVDLQTAYWQNWWLEKVILHGYDPRHSPFLFHPHGLDTAVQPRRWLSFLTWFPFSQLWGPTAAFNLNAMLGLALSGCGAYLLVRHLTCNRYAAWCGAAFFAYYPLHVERALGQPNTGQIQWIAFFMWALVVMLDRVIAQPDPRRLAARSLAWVGVTALFGSLSAYVNLKIWLLGGLFAVTYVLMVTVVNGWWRRAAFVQALAALGLLSAILVAPIVVPMLRVTWLTHAIAQVKITGGADLASFVVHRPRLPPFVPHSLARLLGLKSGHWYWGTLAIGIGSVLCVAAAIALARRRRRDVWIWLFVAFAFVTLSLGSVLQVNGVSYKAVLMPYRALQETTLFRVLRNPFRLALPFSLAWAVLVGYGVHAVLSRLPRSRVWAPATAGVLLLLMLGELTIAPVRTKAFPTPRFYRELGKQPGSCAVIDLPMGRQRTKRWMMYQTVHGRPIVEGMAARMPPGAYNYINKKKLLRLWRNRKPLVCPMDVGRYARELLDDGFCYVVMHGGGSTRERFLDYFRGVKPAYNSGGLRAYRIEDLAKANPCDAKKKKEKKRRHKRRRHRGRDDAKPADAEDE